MLGRARRVTVAAIVIAATIDGTAFGLSSDSIDQCAAPSISAITDVTNLLDHPPQLPIPQIPNYVPNRYEYGSVRLYDEFDAEEKRLGITYAIPDQQIYDDVTNVKPNTSAPFATYEKAAQSVLTQYGIRLRLSPPMRGTVSAHTPTPSQLETDTAKNEVVEIMLFFSQAPKQLIKAAPNLKEIDLTADGKDADIGAFDGEALPDTGTMLVDIINNNPSSIYTTVPHEFMHFLDWGLCGSFATASNDTAYASLNRHAGYTNTWPLPKGYIAKEPPSFEAVNPNGQYFRLLQDAAVAQDNGDSQKVAGLDRQIGALIARVEMESNYSYYNEMEDKAEMGKEMFLPGNYQYMIDRRAPVRRSKFILLMARLYDRAPNVVKDFAFRYGLQFDPYGSK